VSRDEREPGHAPAPEPGHAQAPEPGHAPAPAPGHAPGDGPGDGPVRVLVVDDHPMWRDGVARDLTEAGFAVVGTAGDGDQALRVAAATRPQVVLLDLNLPGPSGADLIARLQAPQTRVLVLSASGERQDVLDAMKAGATGYLVKSARLEDLVAAVRATADGEAVFTPGLAGLVLGEYRRLAAATTRGEPGTPRLTARETEVLRLVAKGLTYPEIAERLVLSTRTVQNHVGNTLAKLQLRNKAQLVRYALEQGLE
jgi:DNA-binding NarL/FixJ family response regulator